MTMAAMEGARTAAATMRSSKRRQLLPPTTRPAMRSLIRPAGHALTILLLLIIGCLCGQACHAQQQGRAAVGIGARVKHALNKNRAATTKSSAVDASTGESNETWWIGVWDDAVGSATEAAGGAPTPETGAVFLTMMLVLLGSYAAAVAMGARDRPRTVRSMIDEEEEDIVIEEDAHMDAALGKVDIGFEGFKMALSQKKGRPDRVILDGSLKGMAQSGRMLAVMGPSGSGKSTFLHALAGRIKDSSKLSLSGRRYFNGEEVAGDSQLPAAFIEQEVNFFPHMTVKETLDFRVELKLGKMLDKDERDEVVTSLMDQLGLGKSASTIVGNSKIRGLSGGERKRLSIACEMISSPPIIMLDEPTSGLDSYQATQVVETLRRLADGGKTVVAVIHQPSQHVFGMFDDLLLISEGKQMFYGEVAMVRSYMDELGYGAEQEVGTAEHVLECVSRVNGGSSAEMASHERIDRLAEEAKAHASELVLSKSNDDAVATTKKKKAKRKYFAVVHHSGANIFRQFRLLLSRSLDEVFRGKGAIIIKTVQQVTLGLIYGGIYQLGMNQASIQDRIGLLSLIVIGATNMAMAGTIRSFPKEKAIVSNEISSNMYGTLPYFVAKAVSEIPLIGIFQTLFGSIIYPLTGLQKGRFRNFIGLTTLHVVASEAVGLLIGSVSPTSDFALALFPPIIVLNIIFDGKNISEESIPKPLRWITKAGLIRWGFEALAINEFEGLAFDTGGPRRGPVAKTGADALERFGLGTRTLQEIARAQANIVGICWFLSYLGLSLTKQRFMVMREP